MSELVLEDVRKQYGPVAALDGVSLRVPAGSRAAIVGPSGSGKTSLLRVVAGFETPDAGRVTLGGDVLANGAAIMPAHRRGVGVVAQDGALFPHLSVGENIGFGLEGRVGRAERTAELIRLVGLEVSMLHRRADQLSGGQQQRVALARAMARRPRLMLLDEPFSGLDTGLRGEMRKAVGDLLAASSITTVLVTHDQAEALSFANQVAVMHAGRLVQTGTPRELYFHPRTPEVATFLGEAILLPGQLEHGNVVRCAFGQVTLPLPFSASGNQVRILIRPEQVRLSPAGAPGQVPEPWMPTGTILAVEFGGAVCNVTLEMPADATGPGVVTIRQSGVEAFRPGDTVRIAVNGFVHAFPPE